MFRAGQPNPYDDIVAKATDENLTDENWEVILNLCDKVQEEGEQGARNVIAALLKRLAHRSPNVQLYALSLGESLSKNCGIALHRELASRAFTGALEKLIVDRTTHEKVRRRALGLIAMWTSEFESEPTLGVMEDCYNNLKAKNYQFETPSEPPPPTVDDEARRREEEELQRVLEMSMRDKGGRSTYAPATSASSSGAQRHASGYVPARSPSPKAPAYTSNSHNSNARTTTGYSATSGGVSAMAASSTSSLPSQLSTPVVTRVRALHTFEPTEPGELAFEKGDVIKVVDRGYKDWWRGQLKGRTGIFPVNYVEPLPEPTAAELAREAEQEAAVFAQAVNVDRLLTMLRSLDASRENLADNEEIQELYRSCMALRPKIVKLIDKYSQKRADLVSMNESFVKARTIFDRIMEDSLARHAAMYDTSPHPAQPYGYGYDQPQPYGYGGPSNVYQPQPQPQSQPPLQPQPHAGPPQHPDPAYAYQQAQVYGGPVSGAPHPLPAQTPYPQTSPTPYSQQQTQQQLYPQQQPQAQQPAEYSPGVHAQQLQPQPQPQQLQPQSAGPPYVFDPNATYSDPNVQAWAQYYAQGGMDTAGAVYFISVPGVKDASPPPEQSPQSHQSSQDPYQAQAQAQPEQQPVHQEAAHQSPTSQHTSYMNPSPQQSQYPSQPYYQDSASALQMSPTSAASGVSPLQRTSSMTAGAPAPYSYHSPPYQQQRSPTAQGGFAGSGSEVHGYAPPASNGYGPPAAAGYSQSSPPAPGYGNPPSGEHQPGAPYPQGAGAHGGVHALQNQFLDMSIGGQVATS
ncbi:uncharacterized protein EDB91DRAFT_1060663 [Suillus paluster]|uniref:uncharacterized protein n=1 Tax=Suillus paluster TaxID=48578 RepID=UPI001B85D3D7|nr:uncharacterized protein EDB91DRAFT_1060663 [Suillus paluster]KAG1728255.1 hypothetical protein EDB91DRAFT_1060663 [Suillus paluster]